MHFLSQKVKITSSVHLKTAAEVRQGCCIPPLLSSEEVDAAEPRLPDADAGKSPFSPLQELADECPD